MSKSQSLHVRVNNHKIDQHTFVEEQQRIWKIFRKSVKPRLICEMMPQLVFKKYLAVIQAKKRLLEPRFSISRKKYRINTGRKEQHSGPENSDFQLTLLPSSSLSTGMQRNAYSWALGRRGMCIYVKLEPWGTLCCWVPSRTTLSWESKMVSSDLAWSMRLSLTWGPSLWDLTPSLR